MKNFNNLYGSSRKIKRKEVDDYIQTYLEYVPSGIIADILIAEKRFMLNNSGNNFSLSNLNQGETAVFRKFLGRCVSMIIGFEVSGFMRFMSSSAERGSTVGSAFPISCISSISVISLLSVFTPYDFRRFAVISSAWSSWFPYMKYIPYLGWLILSSVQPKSSIH